jgi:DGQHR domain-containing protein
MTISTQAIRFHQKQEDATLYATVLPAGQILAQCKVDCFREETPWGYQRPLTRARVKQVSAFLRQEEGLLPTSILLCIRRPDRASFEAKGPAGLAGEWGELVIPAEVTLWVVDGQHRLFGIQRAFTKERLKWAKAYPLPVTILEGIEDYGEMRCFHIVNTRQKGVPTDVVDRHLVSMREVEGVGLIETMGERSYLRARATEIADFLRKSPDSPWFGAVWIPGEKRSSKHLIGQHSLVASLQPVLGDSFIKRLGDLEVAELLVNYWSALKARWPGAFAQPQQHSIQKPWGVSALHVLFPAVVDICRESRDYSSEAMYEIFAEMRLSTLFWHREHGHPLTRERSPRFQRALVQHLTGELPRPRLQRI